WTKRGIDGGRSRRFRIATLAVMAGTVFANEERIGKIHPKYGSVLRAADALCGRGGCSRAVVPAGHDGAIPALLRAGQPARDQHGRALAAVAEDGAVCARADHARRHEASPGDV